MSRTKNVDKNVDKKTVERLKVCVKKSIKRQSTIALISNFMILLSLGLWDIINIGTWYLSSRSFKQSEVQN